MRIIILLALCLLSYGSQAQSALGGGIRGKTRSGTVKEVGVDSFSANRFGMLTSDSLLLATIKQMKTNDSVMKNIINEMYALWREDLSSVDNKVGTRDTVLQEVLTGGRLKVSDDSSSSRSTVKISTPVRVDSMGISITRLDTANARLNRLLDRLPTSLNGTRFKVDDSLGNTWLNNISGNSDGIAADISDIKTDMAATALSTAQIGDVMDNTGSTAANTSTTNLKIDTLTRKIDSLRTFLDNDSLRVWATNGFGSGGGGGGGSGLANYKLYDTMRANTSLNVDSLNSLANSATAGWLSARVDNTSNLYPDYKIYVKLSMANTAPANDKMAYVYIVPWYYDGSQFNASSNGTTTLPFDVQRKQTFAQPNNYRLLGVLAYTTQNMTLQDSWSLSSIFGDAIPDAFSIYIINFTGAAVNASSNVVAYRPLQKVYK